MTNIETGVPRVTGPVLPCTALYTSHYPVLPAHPGYTRYTSWPTSLLGRVHTARRGGTVTLWAQRPAGAWVRVFSASALPRVVTVLREDEPGKTRADRTRTLKDWIELGHSGLYTGLERIVAEKPDSWCSGCRDAENHQNHQNRHFCSACHTQCRAVTGLRE